MAPIPIWDLTGPLPGPDEPYAPLPAIRAELVDPVVIITDPHIVTDFEANGLRMARLFDTDAEKVLLWLIDKSRDLDRRQIDAEFAIDMGPEIRNRKMGACLAEMAAKGRLRVIATRDGSKVIAQLALTSEDRARDRTEIEADFRRLFPKHEPQ